MTNVHSLNNKLGDFQLLLDTSSPDIVILTETWLDNCAPSSLFASCKFFHISRKDRITLGGGVCMLIAKSPSVVFSQVYIPDDHGDLDIVAVDLADSSETLPLQLIPVYRPPNYTSHDNNRLFSVLNSLADDFNTFHITK